MHTPSYFAGPSHAVSRRSFLATTTSLAAAAVWSSRALGAERAKPAVADYPFQLGVASGDPSPRGVVLWTRLAPKPLEGGGMPDEPVKVRWQVCSDEQMTKVVRKGSTTATPEWAHAVHVEVDGLEPDRWYYYQFNVGGETSPVGRTRTMPTRGAEPKQMKLAFASCQHYESGLYTAYEHMVKDELDLIFHLGDYIYEMGARDNGVRRHVGDTALVELAEYRNRHAQYKTDALLQAAHVAAPWMVTWDDHEFANNCAGLFSERAEDDPVEYAQRRANAYKAYYEHMPLRRRSLPKGPDMRVYRQVRFGQLAEFFVLDTRQYRTDQPCGDGNKPPCEEANDPNATLLGEGQERWLCEGLAASQGKWNVLAQQIMMARVDRKPGEGETYSMDQWPGYEANRRRLLQFFYDRKVRNPITLAGDIHSNWANNLLLDFNDAGSQAVATEFVGTSISSSGNGRPAPPDIDQLLADNPFVNFHNTQRGYVRCTITPERWQSDYQVVEYIDKPGAPLVTKASLVVEDGRPEIQQA